MERWDAIVVGAGPNGLAAACTLARAGRSVLVLEANARAGGGTRTEVLSERGLHHDVCSSIHPTGAASPFLRSLDLEAHGLAWARPEISVAHPVEAGDALSVWPTVAETAAGLGRDGRAWRAALEPFVERADEVLAEVMKPLRGTRRPLLMARFGALAVRSAKGLAHGLFADPRTRALFGGVCAHASRPMDATASAAFGLLMLVAGYRGGWPAARGGSQAIADAMIGWLRAHGGEVRTGVRVGSLRELPSSRAVLFDLAPRDVARVAGDALPRSYVRALERFRHGPGAFKVYWDLDGPIPWTDERCRRAATVHVVGTWDELAASERAVARGEIADRPFVLLTQPSVCDPTRAPAGKHAASAYAHVPNGCELDLTARIEAQIERFAPGFRDLVRARHAKGPRALEAHDANLVGGDVGGGENDVLQLVARPVARWDPYSTPDPRLFLCSSSTPPGAGAHGMCGHHAARSALRGVLA